MGRASDKGGQPAEAEADSDRGRGTIGVGGCLSPDAKRAGSVRNNGVRDELAARGKDGERPRGTRSHRRARTTYPVWLLPQRLRDHARVLRRDESMQARARIRASAAAFL